MRMLSYVSVFFILSFAVLTGPVAHGKKLRVVTTTQDPAAITRAIGGDRVTIVTLSKGYQDPHYLDVKPSYMLSLSRADLLVWIGLDMEIGYLPALVQGARNPGIADGAPGSLNLSRHLTVLGAGGTVDRALGDLHALGNPHYWLDPENGRKMARAIARRLTELDPKGGSLYADNLAAFETRLDEKEKEWAARLAPLSGREIVTYHSSWDYFVARYNLVVVGHVEPKPGVPASASHTLALIKTVRAKKVPIILMEVYYDERIPKLIASKSDARVVSIANSVGGAKGVDDYFALFDTIVEALETALGPSAGTD